jgi:hypothetical protein
MQRADERRMTLPPFMITEWAIKESASEAWFSPRITDSFQEILLDEQIINRTRVFPVLEEPLWRGVVFGSTTGTPGLLWICSLTTTDFLTGSSLATPERLAANTMSLVGFLSRAVPLARSASFHDLVGRALRRQREQNSQTDAEAWADKLANDVGDATD